MKAMLLGFVLLTLGVANGPWQVTALLAQDKPAAVLRWEYHVLTKQQVIDLGKKDLAAGLNQLGNDGWELAAVDAVYIFKRPREQHRKQVADLQGQIALAEADLETWKDRVAWSERMAKKGYMSEQQVNAERLQLRRAEMALDKARTELKRLLPNAKDPETKERQPEK
jgi:hypothetical protein